MRNFCHEDERKRSTFSWPPTTTMHRSFHLAPLASESHRWWRSISATFVLAPLLLIWLSMANWWLRMQIFISFGYHKFGTQCLEDIYNFSPMFELQQCSICASLRANWIRHDEGRKSKKMRKDSFILCPTLTVTTLCAGEGVWVRSRFAVNSFCPSSYFPRLAPSKNAQVVRHAPLILGPKLLLAMGCVNLGN